MSSNSPCYKGGVDCPKRSAEPNCHGYCEDYIVWAELERERRRTSNKARSELAAISLDRPKRIRATQRERSQERNK